MKVDYLEQGFYRIVARNGYMQRPRVPEIREQATVFGLSFPEAETTYYLGRFTIFTTGDSKLSHWRKGLFALLSRNAGSPAGYFGLPLNRVVELGAQIQLWSHFLGSFVLWFKPAWR